MMDPVDTKEGEGTQGEETEQEKEAPIPIPTFSDLAVNGFLDNFKLELTHVSQEIRNLTDEQNKLLDNIGEHNTVIQSSPDMSQLVTVMDEMKGGMDRLSKLRHEMSLVHERSEKLRNRAEKLDTFCKNVQKREDDLVAKMDKPGPSDQS